MVKRNDTQPKSKNKRRKKKKKKSIKQPNITQTQIVKVIVNTQPEPKKRKRRRGNGNRRYSVRGQRSRDFSTPVFTTHHSQPIWKNTMMRPPQINGKTIETQKLIDYTLQPKKIDIKDDFPELISFDKFKDKINNDEEFKRESYKQLFKIDKKLAQTILMGAPSKPKFSDSDSDTTNGSRFKTPVRPIMKSDDTGIAGRVKRRFGRRKPK